MAERAFVAVDPATGRRLGVAWNELAATEMIVEADAKLGSPFAAKLEQVAVSETPPARRARIERERRREEARVRAVRNAARRAARPMRFYELAAHVYCRDCRDNLLTNAWRALYQMEDQPPLRPRDFTALGDRPWVGNGYPERYVQCDECLGQWGPDA